MDKNFVPRVGDLVKIRSYSEQVQGWEAQGYPPAAYTWYKLAEKYAGKLGYIIDISADYKTYTIRFDDQSYYSFYPWRFVVINPDGSLDDPAPEIETQKNPIPFKPQSEKYLAVDIPLPGFSCSICGRTACMHPRRVIMSTEQHGVKDL